MPISLFSISLYPSVFPYSTCLPVYSACMHFLIRGDLCTTYRKMWMTEDSSRKIIHSHSFRCLLSGSRSIPYFNQSKSHDHRFAPKIGLYVDVNTLTHNHNYLGSFTQPYHFHILCFIFSLPSKLMRCAVIQQRSCSWTNWSMLNIVHNKPISKKIAFFFFLKITNARKYKSKRNAKQWKHDLHATVLFMRMLIHLLCKYYIYGLNAKSILFAALCFASVQVKFFLLRRRLWLECNYFLLIYPLVLFYFFLFFPPVCLSPCSSLIIIFIIPHYRSSWNFGRLLFFFAITKALLSLSSRRTPIHNSDKGSCQHRN